MRRAGGPPIALAKGLPPRLGVLAQAFARLPGVGEKTGLRYALHLALQDRDAARGLARELVALADSLGACERCGNVAEVGERETLCAICSDRRRDTSILCVVARVPDLLAIERSGSMRGRYFVLGRLLSPLEGIGQGDLPLPALRAIVTDPEAPVREIIVATPPSVDGEATALLLSKELAPLGVALTRLASGVPHGGDLEFADQVTLGRAIEGRKSL